MRKALPYLTIAVLLGLLFRRCGVEKTVQVDRYTDTVVIRDTIRDTLLIPQMVYISSVDTVFLQSISDTVHVPVAVPIEQKTYKTDDYMAIIEGYRPRLIQMEVYPEIKYITNTEIQTIRRRPRFGVGIQAGYGYNGEKISPYIGVGIQYNLFTF